MDTLDAIFSRRSIRAFTPGSISGTDLDTIIRAGAAAPSGGNVQSWVFISITQPRRVQALRAIAPGMGGQPAAVIALCVDESRTSTPKGSPDFLSCYDMGGAMQNMLLAAHESGLGGCAVASFHVQSLATLLNLPGHIKPHLLLAIGKPSLMPSAPPKRGLDEIHFREKYG